MTKDEAMKLAYEINLVLADPYSTLSDGARRALLYVRKRVLEQPSQDLIVGYADVHDLTRDGHDFWVSRQPGKNTVPLYLYGHPPKIWQGLTDEEIAEAAKRFRWDDKYAFASAACWAEEKLREKNHG